MEMINNKIYTIYIIYENKSIEKLIHENINNIEVKTFNSVDQIIYTNEDVDLIIINSTDVTEKIFKTTDTTYLLLTDDNFDKSNLLFLNKNKIIYDIINKSNIDEFIFINRIKVLLTLPKLNKKFDSEKHIIQSNIWKFLDYSNLFIVMLDKELNIKIANYHLSKILGFEDEDKICNLNWSKFLKPNDIDLIKHIHSEILLGSKLYNEFTNDIIDKDNKLITVKWFNVLINHGFNCTFSIGIPLTKKPTIDEDIDSIRAYFKDILEQDKTTINAMKEMTLEYSKKIMNNNINIKIT